MRRNCVSEFTICFILLCLFCLDAFADLVVDLPPLYPTRDGTIYSENDSSNGTGRLLVGRTGDRAQPAAVRRSLVYFNVSSIPAGSIINSVSLTLTVAISANDPDGGQDRTPDLLSLHRLSTNWGESTNGGNGASGGGAQPNDATWNFSRFNDSRWVTPGGDFEMSPSATVTLKRPPVGDDRLTSYKFESSAGLIDDVQNWVNNGSSNFGWMMKYDDEDALQKARGFFSREEPATLRPEDELRPTLKITFTAVPEPSTYMLLGVAAAVSSVCQFRRRSIRTARFRFFVTNRFVSSHQSVPPCA